MGKAVIVIIDPDTTKQEARQMRNQFRTWLLENRVDATITIDYTEQVDE